MEHTSESKTTHEEVKNNENKLVLCSTAALSDDDLSEEAKKQFKIHTDILRTFQMYADHVLANDQLSPIGRHLICTTLEQNYKTAKSVLNYVASHPEVKMQKNALPHPLFICGLPRTGSTLLFNLLACDPACRAPLYAEIEEPVPPIPRADTAAQMEREKSREKSRKTVTELGLDSYEANIRALHPVLTYEADTLIFSHIGFSIPLCLLPPEEDKTLMAWLENDANKEFMYEYHKTFVQMINSVDAPRSHWLFKAPLHTWYLDELLHQYPSAMLIMNHRQLSDVLPSATRLMVACTAAYFHNTTADAPTNTTDSMQTIIKGALRTLDHLIDCMVKFRRTHENVPCFDVIYDDLIKSPIDTVRRIYNFFGLAWSEEFEMAMVKWLQDNPQGKQGRNSYALSDYNLTKDDIELRYKEYHDMFRNSHASCKLDQSINGSI